MLAHAKRIAAFVNRSTGATAWSLDFGRRHFRLVLNVEPWRGLSGDEDTVRVGLATTATLTDLKKLG